jgi:dihydrofolate reductase
LRTHEKINIENIRFDRWIYGIIQWETRFCEIEKSGGGGLGGGKNGAGRAHLMGRKAFCEMASFWPNAGGVLAKPMNEIPKIVFSRKGFDPALASSAKGWADAKVITGDLAEGIMVLKKQPGKDLIAHGGIEFAQNLVQTGLIDEFCIAMHPVAAGRGFSLFEKLSKPLYLKLIDTKVFSTGAMMQVYQPENLFNK